MKSIDEMTEKDKMRLLGLAIRQFFPSYHFVLMIRDPSTFPRDINLPDLGQCHLATNSPDATRMKEFLQYHMALIRDDAQFQGGKEYVQERQKETAH